MVTATGGGGDGGSATATATTAPLKKGGGAARSLVTKEHREKGSIGMQLVLEYVDALSLTSAQFPPFVSAHGLC